VGFLVSRKDADQTLRDMEFAGLVHCHVEGTIPPAAEYPMTDLRKRFVEPIEMIYAWARKNNDALKPRETSRRSM
jgi:DNA-binding HxlR family transcriptional regulator